MPFTKTCPQCLKQFTSTRPRSIYCGRSCYRGSFVKTIQQLLHDRIQKTDGCWLWLGHIAKSGYGVTSTGGYTPERVMHAHRFSYLILAGPIPNGLEPDHLCRNRSCINPSHLELVTHAENMRRAATHRTHCKKGHPFSPENTFMVGGARRCHRCNRDNARSYYNRNKESVLAHRSEQRHRIRGMGQVGHS
jgi:hypothetical protein